VAIPRQDRQQAWERVEAGVGRQEQDEGREGLEQVEHDAVAIDSTGDLRDDGLTLREFHVGDPEVDRQERDTDEQDRQQGRHVSQRGRRVLRFGRLERRYTGRDRLRAGQRDRPGGEGPQQEDEGEWLERPSDLLDDLRLVARAFAQDDDPERSDGDHQEGGEDEQVGRDREDVARLAQPPEVADGDQADRPHPDVDPPVDECRDRRGDLLDRRGGRNRHRQDIVDQQGRCSDQRDGPADVLLRDGVGPAAGRIRDADLAVADRHDHQQDDDGDAHLEAVGECGYAAQDQDPQDLLSGVGG
jgi:hypothetical protein